jgi:hypothetical protein
MSRTDYLLAVLLSLGCGPAQHHVDEPRSDRADIDSEDEPNEGEADDGIAVEGLRGSLNRDEVDPVLNRAAGRFAECYSAALEDAPYLVGDLALSFSVSRDGSVRSVWTPTATLGSRDVEECILRHARSLRFPSPHGGEAELDYGPMAMSPGDDARPPDVWDESRIAEALEAHGDALRACTRGDGGFSVTFYIGPGGRVRSVGAVAPSAEQQDSARCLEAEVAAWDGLPDPIDWVAKVSLEL